MKLLTAALSRLPEFEELLAALERQGLHVTRRREKNGWIALEAAL